MEIRLGRLNVPPQGPHSFTAALRATIFSPHWFDNLFHGWIITQQTIPKMAPAETAAPIKASTTTKSMMRSFEIFMEI